MIIIFLKRYGPWSHCSQRFLKHFQKSVKSLEKTGASCRSTNSWTTIKRLSSPPSVSHGLDTKQTGFPVHSSVSETWCLCGKNAAHLRCLQVVRAGGRGARVRRTPRQPQDKQERHLWVEAIISHPKEIISSAVCHWSTRSCVLRPWPPREKTKTLFHYCLVLIYIKGSRYHCFLPLLSSEVLDESIETVQVDFGAVPHRKKNGQTLRRRSWLNIIAERIIPV